MGWGELTFFFFFNFFGLFSEGKDASWGWVRKKAWLESVARECGERVW